MNWIRRVLWRWASATLPATFKGENIHVDRDVCPKPGDAAFLNQAGRTAYCRYGGKVCTQLQLAQPTRQYVLCRAAKSHEIVEEEE